MSQNHRRPSPKETAKDPYRHFAKRYDAVVEPANATLRRVGLRMLRPRPGSEILEVGCGTGSNLALYEKADCRVSGIDLSPSMLAVAREKLTDRADLRLGDAADMPYPEASFDLVMAFLTLHEMPAEIRAPVVAEMVRVTRPEGRLLFVDFHPGPISFPKGWLYKAVITVMEIAAGREHYRNCRDFLARQGLSPLLEEHELTVESAKILGGGNLHACVARCRLRE